MKDQDLTAAERRALRVVAEGRGGATWYHVARLVTPTEFPEQDTNPVTILKGLESAGLIEKIQESAKMQAYAITGRGVQVLRGAAVDAIAAT